MKPTSANGGFIGYCFRGSKQMLSWSWKTDREAQQGPIPAALEHSALVPAAEATDLMTFLAKLHKTTDIDLLLSTYVSIIGGFVPAPAVAIYLLDADTGKPTKLAAHCIDGQHFPSFLSAYEQHGRKCDPVYSRVSSQLETTTNRLLLKRDMWVHHPFHRVLSVGSLHHILEAPLVTSDKGLMGTLNFGRPATQPHFDNDDVTLVDRIAQHVSIAIGHTAELNELRGRDAAWDEVFDAINTGVMITDGRGDIQFLNVAARHLFQQCDVDEELNDCISGALRNNLQTLRLRSTHTAQCLQLPRRSLNRSAYLTMNSVLVGHNRELVATFWYQPGQDPNFEYLHDLLTPREIKVLELLAQGMENKQIAEFLTVSLDTVKSHLKRIFSKMGVASRAQLLSQVFYQS
ncbi:MAG: GAF domain-containing protein [Actinobacteria bacterium]|nr:GAF domain-containing protein [Actinomycetota bacterium]